MKSLLKRMLGHQSRRVMSDDERRRAKALMLGAVAGPAVRTEDDGVMRIHCEGTDEHKSE